MLDELRRPVVVPQVAKLAEQRRQCDRSEPRDGQQIGGVWHLCQPSLQLGLHCGDLTVQVTHVGDELRDREPVRPGGERIADRLLGRGVDLSRPLALEVASARCRQERCQFALRHFQHGLR